MKAFVAAAFLALALGAPNAYACSLPNGDDTVPYDYFNRTPFPKIEESGITCQDAANAVSYYEDNYGDAGVVSKHSFNWSWQGYGCNAQGSGLPLGYAAKQLTIWGCPSGQLCKMGGNNQCVPY